jgi:hypothetical protein
MDESLFLGGRHNPEEGGPKGLDIDAGSNVLAVTSEYQPLAFFHVSALLERASATQRHQSALDVRYELSIMEQSNAMKTRALEAEALVDSNKNSRSWRLTAPLRRLHSALRRLG